MTDDEIHAALVQWIAATTGASVIQAYQSAPPPAEPYISVALTATRELSPHPISVPIVATGGTTEDGKDELEQTPNVDHEWQFSLQSVGAGCEGLLRKIKNASHSPYAMQSLHPIKLHSVGNVNRLPDAQNLRWDDRAACDLILRGITRDALTITIETIETAPVTITRTA